MLNAIDSVTEQKTQDNKMFGDLFWSMVQELSKKPLVRVGLSTHSEEHCARIIKFYLVTHMHFYAKVFEAAKGPECASKGSKEEGKVALEAFSLKWRLVEINKTEYEKKYRLLF